MFDNVLSGKNLSEDNVLAIQPGAGNESDEELTSVGAGTGVGHRQKVRLGVFKFEVFVSELLTVDGFAAGTVSVGEVTSLGHELSDHSVEG